MALVKVLPVKTGYKGRGVSMDSDGSFLISKELLDEVKNINRVGVTFYQDDKVKADWYLRFETDAKIILRFKKDTTCGFNSKLICNSILKSIGVENLNTRIRIVVGEMIVKEGLDLYPLITSSIKTQLN